MGSFKTPFRLFLGTQTVTQFKRLCSQISRPMQATCFIQMDFRVAVCWSWNLDAASNFSRICAAIYKQRFLEHLEPSSGDYHESRMTLSIISCKEICKNKQPSITTTQPGEWGMRGRRIESLFTQATYHWFSSEKNNLLLSELGSKKKKHEEWQNPSSIPIRSPRGFWMWAVTSQAEMISLSFKLFQIRLPFGKHQKKKKKKGANSYQPQCNFSDFPFQGSPSLNKESTFFCDLTLMPSRCTEQVGSF